MATGDKDLMIITNFGCNKNCPYCISRFHPDLEEKQSIESINWEALEYAIICSNPDAEPITLSGGGDPLYGWSHNIAFYSRLRNLTDKIQKPLDICTRILPMDYQLLSNFRKINYIVDYMDAAGMAALQKTSWWLVYSVDLVVTVMVDTSMKDSDVFNVINYCQSLGIEDITFKEIFGCVSASNNYKQLKKAIPQIAGVNWLDYDEWDEKYEFYFLTTNKVRQTFIGDEITSREEWKNVYNNLTVGV